MCLFHFHRKHTARVDLAASSRFFFIIGTVSSLKRHGTVTGHRAVAAGPCQSPGGYAIGYLREHVATRVADDGVELASDGRGGKFRQQQENEWQPTLHLIIYSPA